MERLVVLLLFGPVYTVTEGLTRSAKHREEPEQRVGTENLVDVLLLADVVRARNLDALLL